MKEGWGRQTAVDAGERQETGTENESRRMADVG